MKGSKMKESNKKRILIAVGIFAITATVVLVLNIFLKPENNVFTQLIGGIVNTQPHSEPASFCKHYGGDVPNASGFCISKELGKISDSCTENVLHKTYCENDECKLKSIDCEEYCQGICLTIAGRGYCACPG
jgi:hypothetical protein